MNNGAERGSSGEDWLVAVQVACCEPLSGHSDVLWGECLFDCLLGRITAFTELLFPKALFQSFLQTLIICLLSLLIDRCFFIS